MLSAAVGSILTIVITELIRMHKEKVAFKRDLIKMEYARKLDAGEKAIAYFIFYLLKMRELKITLPCLFLVLFIQLLSIFLSI